MSADHDGCFLAFLSGIEPEAVQRQEGFLYGSFGRQACQDTGIAVHEVHVIRPGDTRPVSQFHGCRFSARDDRVHVSQKCVAYVCRFLFFSLDGKVYSLVVRGAMVGDFHLDGVFHAGVHLACPDFTFQRIGTRMYGVGHALPRIEPVHARLVVHGEVAVTATAPTEIEMEKVV